MGSRIREARVRAGLTGAQVATAIGAAKTWVYAVEDGQQNFTIQALRRLLRALDLDIGDVLSPAADPAAEAVRLRRLHQASSEVILRIGDLDHHLRELRALTGQVLGGADGKAE